MQSIQTIQNIMKRFYTSQIKLMRNIIFSKTFPNQTIIHIYDVIDGYFEVNNSYEKHKRTIKYFNSYWFIITDKKYIVWISRSLLISLSFIIRGYFLLFISKLTRLISPTHFLECENVNWDLYLCRGALKDADFLECDVLDLDEYMIIKSQTSFQSKTVYFNKK